MKRKALTALSLVLFITALFCANIFATDYEEGIEPYALYYGYLGVPAIDQQPYDYGCWAACGASVCQYYGNYVSMEDFASNAGLDINKPQTIPVVKTALVKNGFNSSIQTGLPSYTTIKTDINNGKTRLVDSDPHALVLEGYSEEYVQMVTFADSGWPFYGDYSDVEYYTLKPGADENPYYYRWYRSLYNIN